MRAIPIVNRGSMSKIEASGSMRSLAINVAQSTGSIIPSMPSSGTGSSASGTAKNTRPFVGEVGEAGGARDVSGVQVEVRFATVVWMNDVCSMAQSLC